MRSVNKLLCVLYVVFAMLPAEAAGNIFPDTLWVPGEYEAWNPSTAPVIRPAKGQPGIFEGYINFTGTGTPGFKFTNAPDWVHINYGYGGTGILSPDGKAVALTAPEAGYYEVCADLNKSKWTAVKTVWSIIGDATPGGWLSDTKMEYDPVKQVWTTTAALKSAGSFKFRANGAWTIDFALDDTGLLQYVDNPLFPYNPKLKNPTVASDGTFTITLDLHNSGKYTYTAVKN